MPARGISAALLLRGMLAVLVGLLVVAVPSLATDQLFHSLDVYPPWGEPMLDTGNNLLALSYRVLFGVAGGFVAALLAPRAPMAHALVLGAIGTLLSGAGAVAARDLSPDWFLLALIAMALPAAWLGGAMQARGAPA